MNHKNYINNEWVCGSNNSTFEVEDLPTGNLPIDKLIEDRIKRYNLKKLKELFKSNNSLSIFELLMKGF